MTCWRAREPSDRNVGTSFCPDFTNRSVNRRNLLLWALSMPGMALPHVSIADLTSRQLASVSSLAIERNVSRLPSHLRQNFLAQRETFRRHVV